MEQMICRERSYSTLLFTLRENAMKTIFNKKRWLLTAPLAVLMAGCNIDNNGSSVVAPPAPITPAAVSGISPVNLGAAGNFVILASSGISTVPNSSAVTGDIGTTYAATAITGFSLIADSTKVFSKSAQVTGNVYGFDYAPPTPANLTTAELNMGAAYSDAAGRAPNYTEVGSGNIGGMTLPPAVYKWSSGVLIPTNVTLNGGPNDVWIFQIAGGITQASGTRVLLAGGALSQNIFWQSADVVALGTTAHLEGIVLAKTAITLASSASVNGRLLSQTAVTLIANTVTQPGSVATADTTAPTATSITPANAAPMKPSPGRTPSSSSPPNWGFPTTPGTTATSARTART